MVVLRVYKRLQQEQPNDKLMISPLPQQIERLVVVDALAALLSFLTHPQPITSYLSYLLGTAGLVVSAWFLSPRTLIIGLFDIMVVLQVRRGFQQRLEAKMRFKLGIRQTNSIYYTPSSPPKREGIAVARRGA